MTDTATRNAEIRSHDLDVGDGMHMRVNESGEAGMPAMLMLHGSGPGVSGMSNWKQLLENLGDRYHCIAPDLIGFGDSSHPDPAPQGFNVSRDLRIEKIIRMLDELGVDTVTLVGNSMGGLYSLRMEQLIPERIDGMVLMGSGGKPDMAPLPGLLKLITYYDNPGEESMRDLLMLFVHDKAAFGPRIEALAAERAEFAAREGIRRSHFGTFAPGPLPLFGADELAAMDVKTLVVHGRNDAIVPLEASYWIADHMPNADLYVVANCGHWIQVEQAQRFTTLLDDFMAGRI